VVLDHHVERVLQADIGNAQPVRLSCTGKGSKTQVRTEELLFSRMLLAA